MSKEYKKHERDFLTYITRMKMLCDNISLNDIDQFSMEALAMAEDIVNSYKQMEIAGKV